MHEPELSPDPCPGPPAPAAPDRRRFERRRSEVGVRVRPSGALNSSWQSGHTVGVSVRGAGLLLPVPFEKGTLLDIELQPGGPAALPPVRVFHSRRYANGWLTGCRFTRLLTDAEWSRWRAAEAGPCRGEQCQARASHVGAR